MEDVRHVWFRAALVESGEDGDVCCWMLFGCYRLSVTLLLLPVHPVRAACCCFCVHSFLGVDKTAVP